MGPEEKLVGGVVEQSEMLGVESPVSDSLVASGLEVCAQLLSVRPSNLLSVSGSELTGSHYALSEHVEASERTQSTGGCWPKGEAGRAPLTKAI
jgi:hypothetical protein